MDIYANKYVLPLKQSKILRLGGGWNIAGKTSSSLKLLWVSDQTWRSTSGLRWVFARSAIPIVFSRTPKTFLRSFEYQRRLHYSKKYPRSPTLYKTEKIEFFCSPWFFARHCWFPSWRWHCSHPWWAPTSWTSTFKLSSFPFFYF